MKINELLKTTEDTIYGQTFEMNGVELKYHLAYAEKVGLANRLFSVLYSDGVYDGVNGKMFVATFLFKALAVNLEFPKVEEELDVDGIYDYLVASQTIEHVNFARQLKEFQSIIDEMIKMTYKQEEGKDSLTKLMEHAMELSPEEVNDLNESANKLMENENIRKMVEFSENS